MEYQCSCCGGISKTKFYKSYSVLNKYRMVQAICKDCLIEIYKDLVNEYKSENKALYRLCMLLDVYYDEKRVVTCKEKAKESGKDLPLEYMPKLSLKQYANKSFIDSDKMELNEKKIVETEDVKKEEKSTKKNKKTVVTPEMIQRWGDNLEENDYIFLEETYKKMEETYDKTNPLSLITYKQIAKCYLEMEHADSAQEKKQIYETISKMTGDCKIKASQQEKDENEAYTDFITMIEFDEPCEKPLSFFDDIDKCEKYFDRFVRNPLAISLELERIESMDDYTEEFEGDEDE